MDLPCKITLPCGKQLLASDISEFKFNPKAGVMTIRTNSGIGYNYTLEDYRECRHLKRIFGSVMWVNHLIAESLDVAGQ